MAKLRDRDVRGALIARLEVQHRGEPSLVLSEFGVPDARVDVAVVNGLLHGVEIKSDADTLERLPRQIEAYGRVFDRVTIVVGQCHLDVTLRTVPDWWGVETVTEGPVFAEVRSPEQNPDQSPPDIAALLWRDEALEILASIGCDRGVKSKPRRVVHQRLADSVSLDTLRDLVRAQLKSRHEAGWRA